MGKYINTHFRKRTRACKQALFNSLILIREAAFCNWRRNRDPQPNIRRSSENPAEEKEDRL